MKDRAFVDTNVLVYSEDMAHGRRYGPVRVMNPFPEAGPKS